MDIAFGSIQSNVDMLLTEKINTAEQDTEKTLTLSRQDMTDGSIATSGEPCVEYIRNVRKNVLTQYRNIKMWFNASIISMISQSTHVDALQAYQEKAAEISAVDANIQKAEEEITHVRRDRQLMKYDKYQQFKSDPPPKNGNDILPDSPVASTVSRIHKKYWRNKIAKILLGIFVSFLFAAIDYNMIFTVLESSNMGVKDSIWTALIFALILDLPPYMLGLLQSQQNDCERLWELRGELNTPGAAKEIKRYKNAGTVIFIATIAIFVAYFALRILLFLGGGDINIVFHSILAGEFTLNAVTFNSSDLMTMFVPFATSATAYGAGILLLSSFTKHIEDTVVIIDRDLDRYEGELQKVIIGFNTEIENLQQEIRQLKQSIWTSYLGPNISPPDSDTVFIARVTDVCTRLDFSLYKDIYQSSSAQLRGTAENAIRQVNTALVSYCADQKSIISMDISNEEKGILDDIWVTDNAASQHDTTTHTLQEIDSQVRLFQQMLKGGIISYT